MVSHSRPSVLMKYILSIFLIVFFSSNLLAVNANTMRWTQRNNANTLNVACDVDLPGNGSLDGVMCASGTTHVPVYKLFGSGLIMDSTSLKVDFNGVAPSSIKIDPTQIYADGTHTSLMDAWMSGIDSSMTSLTTTVSGKANTSSVSLVGFSGQYADLLSKPTLGTASAQNVGYFADAAQGALADTAVQPAAIASFITASALAPYALISSVPTNTNQLTNGAGFITGITGGQVISALGITPISQAGARTAVSLTTTGTSGASTYDNSTGVLNIPNYAPGTGTVTSVSISSSTLTVSGTVTTSGALTVNIPARSFNSAPARTLVSIAAAANGFQISSTRDSSVSYSITISCAVQIGVATNVEGYVVLEICPTNSSTAGDWVEISRVTNAQNIALALALSSTAKNGAPVAGKVPAGFYSRLRSVNVSGTPTYTTNGQQEVME